MIIKSIKTRRFLPPKDDILGLLKESLNKKDLKEGVVIVLASKIVAIWQGRCVKISDAPEKDELIKKEADFYLNRKKVPRGYVMLTIKNNILIPTAGIDESNAMGHYILWPENPFGAARQVYKFIKKEFGIKKFGLIIADSHTTPLRWGTMGIAIAYWGFKPLKDYRGTPDIFGRKLKITQSNIADSLAAAAVLIMGEGKEQTPIALIYDVDFLKFGNFDFEKENPLSIDKKIDIYKPLIDGVKWNRGKGGM